MTSGGATGIATRATATLLFGALGKRIFFHNISTSKFHSFDSRFLSAFIALLAERE